MDWKYEKGRIYSVDENNELLAETTFVFKGNDEVDINRTYVHPRLRTGYSRQDDGSCC